MFARHAIIPWCYPICRISIIRSVRQGAKEGGTEVVRLMFEGIIVWTHRTLQKGLQIKNTVLIRQLSKLGN